MGRLLSTSWMWTPALRSRLKLRLTRWCLLSFLPKSLIQQKVWKKIFLTRRQKHSFSEPQEWWWPATGMCRAGWAALIHLPGKLGVCGLVQISVLAKTCVGTQLALADVGLEHKVRLGFISRFCSFKSNLEFKCWHKVQDYQGEIKSGNLANSYDLHDE